ncbi:type II restriction endonuclease subunit M, partial [Pseudomonas frederiksbergensis]|uniref:BREX-1 system adenine-specific DNA-methyltransferase PglX n=1 Tax=Pseudomonas frederiksbergensis TaxID=104087 RepID=UPI001F11E391
MSTFLRLLKESDKAEALMAACNHLRQAENDSRSFEVASESFDWVPSKPFAYWVSESVRRVFHQLPAFEGTGRTTKQGLATADDFRFVRIWWESPGLGWMAFAKGGAFSPIYADVYLVIEWRAMGSVLKAKAVQEHGNYGKRVYNEEYYFRPGLTWPRRTQGGLSLRAMPAGCIFGDKGPAAFCRTDDSEELLALLALTNSRAFGLLVSLQMAFGSYEVGVIQRTPVPSLTAAQRKQLANLARRVWSLKRTADSVTETSHAFVLPVAIRARAGYIDSLAIKMEVDEIKAEMDAIAFDLYGFAEADREAVNGPVMDDEMDDEMADAGEDDEEAETEVPSMDGLLAWAVGVAFGRFDLRIATGERLLPPEPEPFDPLPTKSPGMLPDGAQPFHAHDGILVDDPGHPHDLARL